MSKRQDIKARNRRQIFWTLLFVFVTVTCMTVYDLKWRNYDVVGTAETGFFYLSPDSDPATIPDDESTLYIWQGRLAATGGGVTVTDPGIAPRTFAQRELDLFFEITDIAPGQQQALVDKVKDIAKNWTRKNNMIVDIVFDIRHLKMDSATFLQFLGAWHYATQTDYHARLLVDPEAAAGPFNGADSGTRNAMLAQVAGTAIILDRTDDAGKMKAAENYGKSFIAFIPADADAKAFEKDTAQKMKYLAFYVKTLPNHVAPKTEATP